MTPKRRNQLVALVSVFLAAFGVTIGITISGPGGPTTSTAEPVATVMIDGPDADTKHDDALPLTESAQDVREAAAAAPEKFDLGDNLRGHDPAPAGVLEGPLASQEWPGCKTAFVRSFSSRRGVKPVAFAVHFTAGGNVTGWADVDGLTAYSNNAANQVSWHFSIDREGHCAFNVPPSYKAWTISALNSQTINVEMVGRGTEPDLGDGAGMARLAQVVGRVHQIYGIPIALGATDGNCHVTRPGIITHWMGGPCSGGHTDIKPYSITGVIAQIAALLKPKPPPAIPCTPRNLEKALARRFPGMRIVVDGKIGSRSRAAIERFQRGNYLHVNGVVGPIAGRKLGLAGCRV
jgi:peptidoglycan hydrolase-like protein with peptidoglycan-binding domain